MSYFDLTVFNRIAAQQKETNDLLKELIAQLKAQNVSKPAPIMPVFDRQSAPYVPAVPTPSAPQPFYPQQTPWPAPPTVWCSTDSTKEGWPFPTGLKP